MRRAHCITFGERGRRYCFAYRVAGALCIKKCMRSSSQLFPLPRISQQFSILQQFKKRNGTYRRYFQPARFFLSILFRLCSIYPFLSFVKPPRSPCFSERIFIPRAGGSSVLSVKYRFHRLQPPRRFPLSLTKAAQSDTIQLHINSGFSPIA